MDKDLGIYIHIPFCISKCHYCDFNSYSNVIEDNIEKYINSLCNEIITYSEILSTRNIKSIYFGGGTPSYIASKYITQILTTLKMVTTLNPDISITIEINPKTLTINKALEYKEVGINRVSIGLQSTYNDILKTIGRCHTYEDFLDTIKILEDIGFDNISCDIMYPLPNLTPEKFKYTLDTIVNNKSIKHISIYNLEVHKGSKLDFLLKEGYISLCNEDDEYIMRNDINQILLNNGYIDYEISNYSKKGYESVHNLMYWNGEEYLGFGAGASSFLNSNRFTNTNDLNIYIKGYSDIENVSSNAVITTSDDLSLDDLKKEYAILQLRLKYGIDTFVYYDKFKSNVLEDFKEAINGNISKGLLIKENNNIYLTPRGKEIANIVWESFI